MTLNATIFPDLDLPTIAVDYTDLVLGPDGSSPDLLARRMGVYSNLLTDRLRQEGAWYVPRRIVVGHSFGGMLALRWWLDHGGAGVARIDGMVLMGATAGPMYDVVRLRLARFRGREFRIGIATILRHWNRPAVTRLIKRLLSGGSPDAHPVDFRSLNRPSDWALDRAGWKNTDWRSMRSYRLALEGFDVRERLAEIDVPVIVLHGAEDTLFPPEVGRALASGLPQADLRTVPGAGHALPLTHGGEVVKAVEDLTASRFGGR